MVFPIFQGFPIVSYDKHYQTFAFWAIFRAIWKIGLGIRVTLEVGSFTMSLCRNQNYQIEF